LLEIGASYGNLVNAGPANPAAAAAGWKRAAIQTPAPPVPTAPDPTPTPSVGDPETSFIVHKLNGDFPGSGFGERMPLGRPKLDQSLIDVITLWIQAGAPPEGWVPGTF
jgi:hypothetical protein